MADLLEGLGDTGNQSGESALPGALGLSVESAAELFSKDSGQNFTKLLKFKNLQFNLMNYSFEISF